LPTTRNDVAIGEMAMITVTVRELKDKLAEYLRRVKAGESILVTERGKTVAAG